jgi:hypothetical protein
MVWLAGSNRGVHGGRPAWTALMRLASFATQIATRARHYTLHRDERLDLLISSGKGLDLPYTSKQGYCSISRS